MAICQKWPKYSGLRKKTNYKLAIQINGKTRQIIDIEDGNNEDSVKKIAINDKKIKKIITNKMIKRTIYVPNKIFNIVL